MVLIGHYIILGCQPDTPAAADGGDTAGQCFPITQDNTSFVTRLQRMPEQLLAKVANDAGQQNP
jgi:predicted nucleic acid-binding Zn ribbon protein